MFLYFKFLERDGNRGLGLLPLYSLDLIGLNSTALFDSVEFIPRTVERIGSGVKFTCCCVIGRINLIEILQIGQQQKRLSV